MSVASLVTDTLGARASLSRGLSVAFFTALGVLAVTGVGLAFSYAPSTSSAWASVYFTEYQLAGGYFVRSLHMVAAEATVVLGALALAVACLEGRYRGARQGAFFAQATALALALVACVSGNPLRWDNRGYFGFLTETNIAGELPGGALVRALMLGGGTASDFTLTRLYAAHALLVPVALGLTLAWWGRASLRAGAEARDEGSVGASGQPWIDVAFSLVAAATMFALARAMRAPLEAPADPAGSYDARPEWYFQSLYVARNAVPPAVQGVLAAGAPVLAAALVALTPRLDADPSRAPGARAPRVAPLLGLLVGVAALTAVGVRRDARDTGLTAARAAQHQRDRRAAQVAKAEGIPPDGALAMMRRDPVSRGEDLFREHCATCHRLGELAPADGKLTAPSLDGFGTEAWALAVLKDPDAPTLFGGSAYKEKMPSMVQPPKDAAARRDWKPVPEADLLAMAQFLAAEARGGATGAQARGAKLIKQRCTSCHLLRGETDDADGLGPELSGWGSLAWIRAQLANPGTAATYRAASMSPALDGHMPRYDDKLSSDDLDLLTRFVWSRAQKSAVRP